MRRGDSELRVRSMGLKARFVFSMTAAMTIVMAVTALLLYVGTSNIVDRAVTDTLSDVVKLTSEEPIYEQSERNAVRHQNGAMSASMTYGASRKQGRMYAYGEGAERMILLVPGTSRVGKDLLGMIVGITIVVILVGAAVAFWVASQVSRPIHRLIQDVRQIAKGDLRHKTHSVGSGEIELLSRSLDRMTLDLGEAESTRLELSIREREMGLATGVREALLPLATPLVEHYDVGAAHLNTETLGGDFHDFIEREDGRIGLLVCDVSGQGIPAALVGATARSYLRGELHRTDDVAVALARVNRWLAGDVRRGMFVTALYVLIDPTIGRATVACAGHKMPLLRLSRGDGRLRSIHPDGIALGFDKGPVFERRLEVAEIAIEPDDRLVLTNSALLSIRNPDGRELGEKAFFSRVAKHAELETTAFLKALRRDVEGFVGEAGLSSDISLVTITRVS